MKKLILICISALLCSSINAQDCLDVKHKLRGYFYAGTSIVDSTALGGFYEDNNSPKDVDEQVKSISATSQLQILALTDSVVNYPNGMSGFKVLLINNSDSTITFEAQDSRLYIYRQAYYNDQWNNIEYIPSSWCGNSYHNVLLQTNEFWEFTAPCLKGKKVTKFRFIVRLDDNGNMLTSNEFEGSFNTQQLTKVKEYKSLGLMDPYDN
jgi:hypothetical protein